MSVCLSVCPCVCPSQAIARKPLGVTIVKFGTLAASGMRMHHVLIALTSIFIQGHTDLNYEKNKCLIIS